jgi:hypothetical protein
MIFIEVIFYIIFNIYNKKQNIKMDFINDEDYKYARRNSTMNSEFCFYHLEKKNIIQEYLKKLNDLGIRGYSDIFFDNEFPAELYFYIKDDYDWVVYIDEEIPDLRYNGYSIVGRYMYDPDVDGFFLDESKTKVYKTIKMSFHKRKNRTVESVNIIKRAFLRCYYNPETEIGKRRLKKIEF